MLEFCSPPSNSGALFTNMNHIDSSHQNAAAHGFGMATPLAALQGMTEMKTPTIATSWPQCTAQQTGKPIYNFPPHSVNGTPHGINDILCRPLPNLGQTSLPVPRLNISPSSMSSMSSMYFGAAARFNTKPVSDLSGRPHLYWPGIPLQAASSPWRSDRYNSCSSGKRSHAYLRMFFYLLFSCSFVPLLLFSFLAQHGKSHNCLFSLAAFSCSQLSFSAKYF